MKTTKRLTAIVLAALAFGACQKENLLNPDSDLGGRLILEAEGMNGAKLAINGNTSHWASGDEVWINNHTYTVDLSESGQATVDVKGDNIETPIYGVYPNSIFSLRSSNNVTVALPTSYTYATCTDGGNTRQNLQSPMMAYAAGGNKLVFKHLTAAVTVEITNDFGIDLQVTSITVSSNLYKLNGSRTFDITNIVHDATAADTALAATDGEKTVTMNCNSTPLIVASGQTKQVQVPVLPVGLRNKFTITVNAKNPDDGDMTYTFTKTQASSGHALLRAQLGYAPAKFGGKFSIGSGNYVRVAPGNLQYQASTGTWRFAKHQYDVIGDDNKYIASDYSGWIDLFGFGTSGWDAGVAGYVDNHYATRAYQPYETNAGQQNYLNHDMSGDYAEADWGWHNAISNGGNQTHMWRTMETGLHTYNDYTSGKVNGMPGVIILCEGYSHPLATPLNTTYSNDYSNNTITAEDWAKMEVAGAIFLPAAGLRGEPGVQIWGADGTLFTERKFWGFYWYANSITDIMAASLNTHEMYSSMSFYKCAGCAVRLVRAD